MSHVDEGALHAYLDGALDALPASEAARIRQHLAECETCARRLEEERALREEAADILAGADPGVGAVVPLEELRRRAGARARVGPSSRLRQLTWAASLVLAVGAGWMLRGSRDPRISQALDPLLREAARERVVPAEERAVIEAERAAPAQAEEAPPAPAPATPRTRRQAAAGEPTPDAAARVADAPEVEVPVADERLAGAAALAGPPRAETAAGVAPSMAVTAGVRAGELSRELAQSRAVAVAAEQGPAVRPAAGQEGVIAVPGLPILSVETGRADLPAGTLRVLQLMEADTLELLHLPAGADPSAVSGPGDARRTEVAVRYGAGWLLGRAHASAEVIEALLARVTGGG